MLKRKFYYQLQEWKKTKKAECLLVNGARQIGKTYIIEQFGKHNYESYIYLNFVKNPEQKNIFEGSLEPEEIFQRISLYVPDCTFIDGNTLLFIDEIQVSPKARTALKFLALDSRCDVIASGSLLGIHYNKTKADAEIEKELSELKLNMQNEVLSDVVDEDNQKPYEWIEKNNAFYMKNEAGEYTCKYYVGSNSDQLIVANMTKDFEQLKKDMITCALANCLSGDISDDLLNKYISGFDGTNFSELKEFMLVNSETNLTFRNNDNDITNYADIDKVIDAASRDNINFTAEFQNIINMHRVDVMVSVLGEPKYAWADSNDTSNTGNADSRAQWYTNLFNRMKKGYQIIENGLASSNDWIEYAFNSGLVTMEQVDKNFNWVAQDYKTCVAITEKTDNSAAVAIAEAQYNRAMNDIQAKDSLYDMQLKNIDTEHNSLLQEYESIQKVISKNIDRTMKFDQSG